MTQTKHTPGPWLLNSSNQILGSPEDGIPNNRHLIAEICGYAGAYKDESEANARLIAAAPLMYEALKVAIDNFTYGGSKQGIHNDSANAEIIRAALKAAEVSHV